MKGYAKILLLLCVAFAVVQEPLVEKIVSPYAAITSSIENIETIAQGVIWHPPFEIANTGNSAIDHMDDGGHVLGTHFLLLAVALSCTYSGFVRQNPFSVYEYTMRGIIPHPEIHPPQEI